MKIGIITFWDSRDNYGQQLQCYALQAFLKQQGHQAYLIRFKEIINNTSGFKFAKIFTYAANLKAYINYVLQRRKDIKYAESNQLDLRDFDGFRNKYISSTDTIYSEQSLMENPPEGDAFICGSDQIWGGSLMYYLSFVPNDKIKIAYAPSFGGINPFNGPKAKEILKCLSRFDFIGVREASGAKLLNEHGFPDAIQVVDPTMLLESGDYASLIEEDKDNNNAFIYLLGNQISCSVDSIIKYVESCQMNYTYVASQGRVDKYPKVQATIPEWIGQVKNSRLVITNSFHCVVFSLIFHKPFIFIPLGGMFERMNDRVIDLLEKCGLQSQIFHGDFQNIKLDLDFSKFDSFKNGQKQKSKEIFDSLLRSDL